MSTISFNPYIVGNPIKSRQMFFGREDDFAFVQKKIGEGRSNQIVVLCGERRSGKTSILFQILGGRLGDSFLPVLVDMQMLAGVTGEREFFSAILRAGYASPALAGFPSDPPAPPGDAGPAAVLDTFLDDLERWRPGRIVLFLFDEYELIEAKIRDGSLGESVIHSFAGLLEGRHRLSFLFTGSTNLEDREGHIWTSLLGKSVYRKISYLSPRDTRRLIVEPLGDAVQWSEEVAESIVRLTGGQPFYTQVICQNVVDLLMEEERNNPSAEDLDRVVREIVDNPLPQMIYSWNAIPRDEQVVLSALAGSLETPAARAEPAGVQAFLSGSRIVLPFPAERINVLLETAFHGELLEKDGERDYRFRMDILRRWIRREHSIWKVAREAGLEFRRRRRPRLLAICAAGLLCLAAAAWFLPGPAFLVSARAWVRGSPAAPAESAPLEGITFRANRGPFRLSIDGQQAYTSEGAGDGTAIVIPSLDPGKHAYRAVPDSGTAIEATFDVSRDGEVIRLTFAEPRPAAVAVRPNAAPAATETPGSTAPADDAIGADVGSLAQQETAAAEPSAAPAAAPEVAVKPGTLVLTSRPPDARVIINGKDTGRRTPYTESVPPGDYVVILELTGYRRFSESLSVTAGTSQQKDIVLEQAFAWLSLDVRPTAKIYLDDVFLVETPIARPVAVPAGVHTLRIENEDLGVKKTISLELGEGEIRTVREKLTEAGQ